MPPQASQSSAQRSDNHFVTILVIVFLFLMLISVWMYKKGVFAPQSEVVAPVEMTSSKEKTTVASVDLTQVTHRDQLPAGFPSTIPVETSSKLSESYVLSYPDRNMKLYTVSFSTKDSVAAQFALYRDFMKNSGYTFGEKGINEEANTLYGSKDNDDLTVVIEKENSMTTVSIGYVDRE